MRLSDRPHMRLVRDEIGDPDGRDQDDGGEDAGVTRTMQDHTNEIPPIDLIGAPDDAPIEASTSRSSRKRTLPRPRTIQIEVGAPRSDTDADASVSRESVAPVGERTGNDHADEDPDGTELGNDADGQEIAVDAGALEALLFSTHHPLTAGKLAELLDLAATKPIRAAIRSLNEQYEQTERSFRVEHVAGGYQLLTLPTHGDLLKKLHNREADAKLTKAALETLAIIAYKQPILRADVEAIRGVACGETIRNLMEKHLVKIAGRAEEPGRPILYGTTRRFLELFGLNSLKDLPQSDLPDAAFAANASFAPADLPNDPPPHLNVQPTETDAEADSAAR